MTPSLLEPNKLKALLVREIETHDLISAYAIVAKERSNTAEAYWAWVEPHEEVRYTNLP